jgi:membrane protein DedA with SNARE-associated domain
MVPFLFTAGAMQYPARKFLAALALGRISRYMLLAYLAARYGRKIIRLIAQHAHPIVVGIIVGLIAIAAVAFYFWRGKRSKSGHGD